jgi:hypothetical protein
MSNQQCSWAGCANDAEATLDFSPLCHVHFYEMASKQLEEYRDRLSEGDPTAPHRSKTLKFVSELIGETTNFVARTKVLAQAERDKFIQLSLAAAKLYSRVQRHPRVACNMPILICRQTDSTQNQELTNTVNVSKRGACISTKRAWRTGEKIWLQRPRIPLRALAWVVWEKNTGPSQFLIGVEILDREDFWKSELAASEGRSFT